jgi:ribulose-phosphate 3-epimerase
MIEDADRYIPAFAEAGADWISVHQEACIHLHRTLQLIRSHRVLAGVVLNPATPIHLLDEVLPMVDFVLIMSVNPGFGGQKFIPESLEKISKLVSTRRARGLDFRIALDTIGAAVRAGAEVLVAGSAIFGRGNPKENAANLLKAANQAILLKA